MHTSKIIIIDDNGKNGELLSRWCRALAPDRDVSWLRVTNSKPDPLAEIKGVSYKVISSLDEAAKTVKQEAGDASCDLIVFYDLQLGTLQDGIESAKNSVITKALKELMQEADRKMLVNVHSSDLNSIIIARDLDKDERRVIYTDVVTRDKYKEGDSDHSQAASAIVAGTLEKWEKLYPSRLLSAEEFLDLAERLTHSQIQDYPKFLKEMMKQNKIDEVVAREKYQDPKEMLRRYLGMGIHEFEDNFCVEENLKAGVIEALKSISGVFNLETNANEFRRLWWSGAWLLALGEFRRLACKDKWKEVFKVEELDGAPRWPRVHAKQTPERRRKTLRLFVEMCRVMFREKGTEDGCVLEKVELTAKQGQPQKLSFLLSFPCVSKGESQEESLLGRIMSEVDYALTMLEKREEDNMVNKEGHDTSRAVWRFFLSSCICDFTDSVSKQRSGGMFGGLTRVNIVSVENGNKTEVVWQT